METNKDLESKLRHYEDELNHCAALIGGHNIEPVQGNILKIGHI